MEKLLSTKKITLATLKSFVSRNKGKLFIDVKSDFDGMQDCVVACHGGMQQARYINSNMDHTLGIDGLWLVGSGRNYFSLYEQDGFVGIKVYNSCGSSVVAVKK